MRGLTVRQPWAWAIIHGGKDVENRTRNIAGKYRGPVAIHAASRADYAAQDRWPLLQPIPDAAWFLQGAVVGLATLWDTHYAHRACCPGRDYQPFGSPWAQPDSWHIRISDPIPLPKPFWWRGALGLWTVPDDLEALIREQVTV